MNGGGTRTVWAAAALRAVLLAALVALLLAGDPGREGEDAPLEVRGDTAGLRALAAALARPSPPPVVLRRAGPPPTEAELELLEAVAGRSRLVVELPDLAAPLRVRPPGAPLAGRAAAVAFEARGVAGDSVVVRLMGAGDVVLDSARAPVAADGRARGAFRVRPDRPGWSEWRVADATGAAARAAAWVVPADPPRVLAVAGPPSWEARMALRALERSGLSPATVQDLGRGNVVTGGGAARRWWTAGSLARYDVVVLLPGARPPGAAVAALAEHVAAGHGVLIAGGAAPALLPALGLGAKWGAERAVEYDALTSTLPAELAPLPGPGDEGSVTVRPVGSPGPAAVAAVEAGGGAVLALVPFGRGRAAALGAHDTWRAAMAGAGAGTGEHAEFWRSLVDWLAAPAADPGVRVSPASATPPATVTAAVIARDGSPPELAVRRPDGTVERLPLHEGAARFVAADTGLHEIVSGGADGRPVAGFRAEPPASGAAGAVGTDGEGAVDGVARLALLAARTGGETLEPAGYADRAREIAAAAPGSVRRGRWWAAFVALLLVAAGEWTLRRVRGLP